MKEECFIIIKKINPGDKRLTKARGKKAQKLKGKSTMRMCNLEHKSSNNKEALRRRPGPLRAVSEEPLQGMVQWVPA